MKRYGLRSTDTHDYFDKVLSRNAQGGGAGPQVGIPKQARGPTHMNHPEPQHENTSGADETLQGPGRHTRHAARTRRAGRAAPTPQAVPRDSRYTIPYRVEASGAGGLRAAAASRFA